MPLNNRRAAVALLCCDLADENSYKSLSRWVSELREVLGDKVLLEVVITKTDLQREPRVPREVVEAYAKSLHPNTSVAPSVPSHSPLCTRARKRVERAHYPRACMHAHRHAQTY